MTVESTIGVDNHVPTNTVVSNSCCSHVVNGENTPSSPSQVAARPKNTPAPKPLSSEPASDTGNLVKLKEVYVFTPPFLLLCYHS